MTISTTNAVNNYTANGTQTTFAYTYQILSDQQGNPQTSTVQVSLNGVVQNSGFTTTANSNQATNPGGSVTFNTAPVNGTAVQLLRNTPVTQALTFPLESKISTPALETALDKTCLIVQEAEYQLSLKPNLPSYAQGDVPTWDPTGNTQALVNQTPAQLFASIPNTGSGNVIGPTVSIVGNIAAFNNTNGQLLKDSGIAAAGLYSTVNPPPMSAMPAGLLKIGGITRGALTGSLRGLPNIPTGLAAAVVGATGGQSCSYKVLVMDATGVISAGVPTAGSTCSAASVAVTINNAPTTINGVNYVQLTCNAATNISNPIYVWYRTAGGTQQGYLGTTTVPTFNDQSMNVTTSGATPPTSSQFVGEFWHTGNFSTDAPATLTRCRMFVDGNFTQNATHSFTINTELLGGQVRTTTGYGLAQGGQGIGGGSGSFTEYNGVSSSAGSGGGANGGAGGLGGAAVVSTTISPGPGGQAYPIECQLTGSGGGGGGKVTTSGGAGGNGGGAWYLNCSGNVSLNANITGNGGNGGDCGGGTGDAAGSGGSGATLAHVATGTWTFAGGCTMSLNGGNGGAGGASGIPGAGGGAGKCWVRAAGAATNSGTITQTGGSVGSGSSTFLPTAGSSAVPDILGNIGYSIRTAA